MHKGQFIFTQVCKFLPKRAFDCLVNKYDGNKWVKSFTCWNHLLVLILECQVFDYKSLSFSEDIPSFHCWISV